MRADLPVPVGPTKRTGISLLTNVCKKNVCLVVSTVGIIRSLTYSKFSKERERERGRGREENKILQNTCKTLL